MEKDLKDVYEENSLDLVEYGQSEPTGDINPLHGIPKAELINRVRSFCADHDLQEHVDVFIRGSLVAQHPEKAQSIEELSDEERAMFNKASGNKWWQTKMMYFTGGSEFDKAHPSIHLCPRCCYSRLGSNWFERCKWVDG